MVAALAAALLGLVLLVVGQPPNQVSGQPDPVQLFLTSTPGASTLTFTGSPMIFLGGYIQYHTGDQPAGYNLRVTNAAANLTVNLADGSVTGSADYTYVETTSGNRLGVSCEYTITDQRKIQDGNLGRRARSASRRPTPHLTQNRPPIRSPTRRTRTSTCPPRIPFRNASSATTSIPIRGP